MKRWTLSFVSILLGLVALMTGDWAYSPSSAEAAGSLQVLPTRLVFEGRTRTAIVNIINNGDTATTYRVSVKNMRMLENGHYEDVKEPQQGEKFADKMLVFSPRQVVLKPGEAQTVRIMLRKKRGLPPGEYRSHFLFRAMPPEDAGKDIETLQIKKGDIRVALIPIFGVTIPVIVRHGQLSSQVKIDDLKVENHKKSENSKILSFKLNRNGTQSVYGDIRAIYSPKSGDELEVARINGVAVYTPNPTRALKLVLHPPEGTKIEGGRIQLSYIKPADEGGEVLAEAEVSLP